MARSGKENDQATNLTTNGVTKLVLGLMWKKVKNLLNPMLLIHGQIILCEVVKKLNEKIPDTKYSSIQYLNRKQEWCEALTFGILKVAPTFSTLTPSQ